LAPDDAPVREFMANGKTGYLVPPDKMEVWEDQARRVLENPAEHRWLGQAAAAMTQSTLSQDVTLPKLAQKFQDILAG
jgi:glycosyltransferase involved in cell wall biosynthesis